MGELPPGSHSGTVNWKMIISRRLDNTEHRLQDGVKALQAVDCNALQSPTLQSPALPVAAAAVRITKDVDTF